MNSYKQGQKKGSSRLVGIMLVSVLAMGVLSECRAADSWEAGVVECSQTDYDCRLVGIDREIERLDIYSANDDNFKLTGKQPKNALPGNRGKSGESEVE